MQSAAARRRGAKRPNTWSRAGWCRRRAPAPRPGGRPQSNGVTLQNYAPVAQLDRASASGAEGHRFESCRAHQPFPNRSERKTQLTLPLVPPAASATLNSAFPAAWQAVRVASRASGASTGCNGSPASDRVCLIQYIHVGSTSPKSPQPPRTKPGSLTNDAPNRFRRQVVFDSARDHFCRWLFARRRDEDQAFRGVSVGRASLVPSKTRTYSCVALSKVVSNRVTSCARSNNQTIAIQCTSRGPARWAADSQLTVMNRGGLVYESNRCPLPRWRRPAQRMLARLCEARSASQ